MSSATVRNLHVPLPLRLYDALRAAAAREGRPATQVARAAIAEWLSSRRRRAVEDELRAYIASAAGGPDDLDETLEEASLAHLVEPPRRARSAGKRRRTR
jgi:hypothetical protein